MIRRIITTIVNGITTIIEFVKNVVIKTGKVIIEYSKEVIINAPAVAIMTFSAFGIANVLHNTNVSVLFVSVPFINEVGIISVLSITAVLMLSSLAGKIAESQMNY